MFRSFGTSATQPKKLRWPVHPVPIKRKRWLKGTAIKNHQNRLRLLTLWPYFFEENATTK
jgi:hypothetical protein